MTESASALASSQQLLLLLPNRQGHFLFESGLHGDTWLDLEGLFSRPAVLQPIVDELAGRLDTYGIEGVCGPMIGGALLAQMIAETLDVEFYLTERVVARGESGVRYRLAESVLSKIRGKSVAVVDDAISAGSAVGGTLAALCAAGAKPVVAGALVLVGSTAESFLAAQKMPVEYIARLSGQLWPPAACPLCAAGIPLEVS